MRNLPATFPRIFLLAHLALAFSLLASFAVPAHAGDASYPDQLVAQAQKLRLHEERQWLSLLHYGKGVRGPARSRIGDERFFLSPRGKTDPQAELEATVRSFFVAQKDGEHAACRYPARFEWLKKKLDLDTEQLPPYTCTEMEKTFQQVDAKAAVLVFPVGHINSPASMFGHTLLRFDSDSASTLISYAANYAAVTTDANGFAYAFKGIFGLYNGYYSLMPYYKKVKEYNDLEHRDMWEYPLRLSQDEVRFMLKHLWELQTIASPYYFFDENCSYNLLFLIEAARPQLHLTDRTGVFVLPTDTIRIALDSGIAGHPRYRPSQGTRIKKMLSLLDLKGRVAARELALASEDAAAFSTGAATDADKMKALDLAAEYLQFRLSRDDIPKDEYSRLYLKILTARSRLGAAPTGIYDIDPPPIPESGHRSTRVAAGAAVRRGHVMAQLEMQPAFHGLLDPDQGYLSGAQIRFFDTALWYDFAENLMRVKRLHLLDILSLAERDTFFKPLSWRVNTGFDTEAMASGRDSLIYRLNTGGGLAYTSPFGGLLYGLAEVDMNAGRQIRGIFTIGPGLTVGSVEHLAPWWKVHLFARGFLYEVGDDRRTVKLGAQQNFRLGQNNSVSLDYMREFLNGTSIDEGSATWNFYF